MQNKNLKIVQIGCVFVECDLFYTTTFIKNYIYEFSYKETQFYINFLRQEHQEHLIGIIQLLRFSGFILHLISFFIYSPFKDHLKSR